MTTSYSYLKVECKLFVRVSMALLPGVYIPYIPNRTSLCKPHHFIYYRTLVNSDKTAKE